MDGRRIITRWLAHPRARLIARLVNVLVVSCVLIGAIWYGVRLRPQVWEWTQEIRFDGDISNGFNWGRRANAEGYFSVYERLGELPDFSNRKRPRRPVIDYAPLRLGLMTWWVSDLRERYPDDPLDQRQPTWTFHAPLLRFNLAMELATMAGVFVVARHLARWRFGAAWSLWLGAIAALITLFNPLIIFNAHAWPQWDIWPMPFFVWAVYCGLRRWWLLAGLILGIAPALKGQILMVAWVLPLWALVAGEWRGALRLLIGATLSLGLIGLPWAISHWNALIAEPRVFDLLDRHYHPKAIAWIVALLLASIFVPRRFNATLIAGALALGVWSVYWIAEGNLLWLQYSFGVGTENYNALYMGPVSNLPALLVHFGWDRRATEGGETVWFLWDLPLRTVLLILFFSLSAVCAVLAGLHDRRRDARLIVALCLPWALFYAIPAQIHERYLLYVSACAGMFVVCGFGWLMMGLLLTLLGFIATIHCAVASADVFPVGVRWWDRSPLGVIHRICIGTHPGIAWALLLGLAVMMWGLVSKKMSCAVRRARKENDECETPLST